MKNIKAPSVISQLMGYLDKFIELIFTIEYEIRGGYSSPSKMLGEFVNTSNDLLWFLFTYTHI